MKRFLPMILALSVSAIAVAMTLIVFRPRLPAIRDAAGELRHKVGEVIEEITELEEADR